MLKDASYHKSAIQYNEELADFAEDLAEKLDHEEVARWCRSVAKQHRFHAGRHKRGLAKLEKEAAPTPEVVRDDIEEATKQEIAAMEDLAAKKGPKRISAPNITDEQAAFAAAMAKQEASA